MPRVLTKDKMAIDYGDKLPGLVALTLETLEGEAAAMRLFDFRARSVASER